MPIVRFTEAVSGVNASRARRGAFTLVELLVVIGILGVLAALVLPAVVNARSSARNAAVKAEIDLLHMAIMNYRNEYGSFPPCLSDLSGTGAAARHLQRIFPRCSNVVGQLGSTAMAPDLALVAWLNGYTNDPTLPVTGTATGGPRRKLFDFDQSRLVAGEYAPSSKPGSPYVYIDNTQYGTVGPGGGPTTFSITTSSGVVDNYFALRQPTLVSGTYVFTTGTATPFNADTFQILCAGQDQKFGTDDDLSNFWKGTRKQYIDGLSNQ